MLSILFNWLYIGVTVFCLGSGFSALSGILFGYKLKRMDSVLMAGIIIATIYAQIFSLFAGVGITANLVLIVGCAIIFFICRKSMISFIKSCWTSYSISKRILLFALIVLWAYFTSRGYIHLDSDLYHAQSIRWIEEYGVVPGQGNLHGRFAYNSSSFALSALYSMRFFSDESIHAVSGFFALLLSITALDITKSWKGRKFILSDYARVAAVYYLTTIADEVVSPASDYVIMCMIFFIVIKWLDCLADEEDSAVITPYALLCVACVYAITLKLTAGVILILLLKPAYELLRQKKWRDIFLYLGMGLIVAVPWFDRTVMISGWLLYPFPALDLFDVDWKMSAELIKVDAAQISTWGKALYNSAMADAPVNVWFPNWFSTTLSGTEKILILGDFVCILVYVLGLIWTFFKKKWGNLDKLLVLGAVICSYLFWQFSAPLIRYGYAYVLLVIFLVAGWIIISIGKQKIIYYAVLLYGLYKAAVLGDYITNSYLVECYIYQQDYGEYEMVSYKIGDFIFYVPAEGVLQGDDYFPSTPTVSDAVPRGDSIEKGFRYQ